MAAMEVPAHIRGLLKDPDALIAAIAQDATTHEVLMLAWMNQEALAMTIETRRATYWSRSRQEIWVKGEISGHTQSVESISLDCDADALLLQVHQIGVPCHTGAATCFHQPIEVTVQ